MKNKFKIQSIYIILFFLFLLSQSNSSESFVFDVTEIEITNNGNKFTGKNGGTAKTEDGVTIFAENFIYDKLKNILYANSNVKIEDKKKNIIIFSDKITYLKNEEIINSDSKSKAQSDGLIIIAKSFTYNKNLNTFNAKGDVEIIDETNNYSGFGENVTYFKNNEKIVTIGNTTAELKSKYKFNGRDITILRDKNELKSSYEAKIEDLDYTEYKFEKFIYYVKDEFLKAKNITIISDTRLAKGETDRASFLDGFFDLKKKSYNASKTTVKIKKNSFDNNKNDPRIIGVSSQSNNNVTSIEKAVFTSCEIKNEKCPPWSIKAKKITHNKNKKQLIYDQAILQVYNKPVMYFPKFFHPDPTVERQSGFLRPQLNNSDILGSSIYIPYFHVISQNKDFTFKPTIFDSDIKMIQSEYRQENLNSSFIVDYNFVQGYKSTSLNKKSSLTHLFSKYNLDLNLKEYTKSFISFFVEKTNNDTYLKIFETNLIDIDKNIKPGNNSSLHSGIKIELDNENFNFSSGMDIYENLSIGKSSDKYQYILPYYNFSKNIFSNVFGVVDLSSSGSNKLSNTNNLRSRIINDISISSYDSYTNFGFKNNINAYFKNLNTVGKNDEKYKSRPSMEVANIYELNTSLPMKKIKKNITEFLTPKLSFRINPGDMHNNSTNKRLITTDNIFDINRIGATDAYEAGKSLTLGIDYKREQQSDSSLTSEDINNFFEFKLASVLRDNNEDFIPTSSTLNQKNSNLFGSIKKHHTSNKNNSIIDSVKLDYYFSLNNDLNNFEYNSFGGEFSINNFTTSLNFIEENGSIGDSNILENSFSYNIDEFNSLSFNTRRNRKISLTEYYDFLYEYKNDCLTAGIKYKKTYYQDRDLKPTEDLMLSFTFYPLTTYEQAIDQNLYRD